MPIIDRLSYSRPEKSSLEIVVETQGDLLTVKAGTFKINKESFELTEDEEFTITQRDCRVWIKGYLVQRLSDSEVRVIIDEELEIDGWVPTIFEQAYPEYRSLESLLSVTIPANVNSFDELDVEVQKILDRETYVKAPK